MNALVVFDSNHGNTRKIAEAIAETLGARAVAAAEVRLEELSGIDLLVVGSPILGWRPSEKTIAFLGSLRGGQLAKVKAAAFDTRIKLFIHGDAAGKIARALAKAGAEIITEPNAFYVKGTKGPLFEGELEKARDWAEMVKERAGFIFRDSSP